MIVFDLECHNGHAFEGWFDDGGSFVSQQEQGLVQCPVCGSTAVDKKLSPVAALRTSPTSSSGAIPDQETLAELGRRLTDFVEANFENVGAGFAKEALKIHYGVSEKKNIRGVTTPEEDRVLSEEGVQVFRFPMPAKPDEDLN